MRTIRYIIPIVSTWLAVACTGETNDRLTFGKTDNGIKPGNITCSLHIDNADQTTRTVYGELSDGRWPIYWHEGDEVLIFCPQTQPTSNNISIPYTGERQSDAEISDIGLSWTEAESYDFYSFYPASAVISFDGATVRAAMPSIQNNENGGCEMSREFMTAKAENIASEGKPHFNFTPIATAVAINVTTSDAVEIQKIVLSSKSPLTGKFDYDISTGTCTPVEGEISHTLALHLRTGNTPYVKLAAGEKASIMAFLLPQDIHGMTLSVITSDGKVYCRSTEATLKAGYRYSMTISDMQKQMNISAIGPDWMKYLPDNAYLSQISIPGSHDACAIFGNYYEYKSSISDDINSGYHFKWLFGLGFTYTNTTKATKAQELSIEKQLEAGVRMFDLRPKASNDDVSDLAIHHGIMELGDPSIGGYTAGTSGRQKLNPFTLSKVLNLFVDFLNKHPDETLLVHMKYENTSTSSAQSGWRKSVVHYIRECCGERIADFTPDMTLADARGKILFMIRVDYKQDNDESYFGSYIAWTEDKIVFETDMVGNDGRKAEIICNDLYALSDGQYDGLTKQEAIDKCIDFVYGQTDITRWAMNYTSCYDTKHCSITGLSILGALGDIDYCANIYNKYAADKIASTSFHGNTGIVLMDYAGAARTFMTYGSNSSDIEVFGDKLVQAIIDNNNKWDIIRKE